MTNFDGRIMPSGSIELQDIIDELGEDPQRGAITTFTGVTRISSDKSAKNVTKIEIETWEENSTLRMREIAKRVGEKYNLLGLRIIHLEGIIDLGNPIVYIVISSAHRQEAFGALEEAIYEYKNNSPVWKKEIYEDGSGRWITTADKNNIIE